MAGFIYIMSNPAYSRIKIGKSTKDPTQDRVGELYQTGVPEPMKVEYYAFVEDENLLERLIHQLFDAERPNKSREFFELDVPTAIESIRKFAAESSPIKYEEVYYSSGGDWGEEVLDQETHDDDNVYGVDNEASPNDLQKSEPKWRRWPYIISGLFLTVIVLSPIIGPKSTGTLLFPIMILGLLYLVITRKR